MIVTSIVQGVATITLDHPKRANALSLSLITLFSQQLHTIAQDDTVYAVVITGHGDYFCSGMDLSAQDTSPQEAFQQAKAFFELVYMFPKPVVARMNGPALGGGVGLLFACDVRVGVKNAYIQLSEVKLGLVPAIISKYIVPEVGKARAAEWMLCGERVSTSDLHRLGVLHSVVEVEVEDAKALDEEVRRYTNALASSAPGAMKSIKRLIRCMDTVQVDEHIQNVFENMFGPEAMYGMAHFRQKKKPDWRKFTNSKL